jgi:IMP cyclohydrolase
VELNGRLAVLPREGHESDVHKNPYIAYNCLRIAGPWAVATNGSQTDPIAEKIEMGMPVRDALAATLLALDFEKDDYATPRVAGVVPLEGDTGWLGIVRRDALIVKAVPLEAGRAAYVATYEANEIGPEQVLEFDASDAAEAARRSVDGAGFSELTNAVTSGAALASGPRFELATYIVE